MASRRQNFMNKLKGKAQSEVKKPIKKRKRRRLVKAESPIPRDLTNEELELYNEIIEDSSEESMPPKKKYKNLINTDTTEIQTASSLSIINCELQNKQQSTPPQRAQSPSSKKDLIDNQIDTIPSSKPQNQLPSLSQVCSIRSELGHPLTTVSYCSEDNGTPINDTAEIETASSPSILNSEILNKQQSTPPQHVQLPSPKKDLIDNQIDTIPSSKRQNQLSSLSQECSIRSELDQPLTITSYCRDDDGPPGLPGDDGSELLEAQTINESSHFSRISQSDQLSASKAFLRLNQTDSQTNNSCNIPQRKYEQSLPRENITKHIGTSTVSPYNKNILQASLSTPIAENYPQKKRTEFLSNNVNAERQNDGSKSAEISLPTDDKYDKTARLVTDTGDDATYEDSLFDKAFLHSVNPTLGVDSIPASPALLNNIDKNVSYDSPNFSPYNVSEQIRQLGSDFMITSYPGTPKESASVIASPPALPKEVESNSQLNNNSSRSASPRLVAKKKRIVKNKKDKGRIRKVHKNKWKDVERKNNKNSGKEYQSRNGKVRKEKEMGPSCKDSCKFKCSTKFSTNSRQKLFKEFWKLGELMRHWDYITKFCDKITKRRITTETDSRRQYTIRYYLPDPEDKNKKNKVCKTMFLNTFGIGEGLVYSALNKLNSEGTVGRDLRGSHTNHKKVITEEKKTSVCDHIKSFSPIESHYVRSQSSKVYLDSSLSVARMFLLYQEWDDIENRDKVGTVRQYRDILNDNFNLGFYCPKKDQCDVCQEHKHSEKPLTKEEHEQYSAHIRNKTIARELKNKDKEIAKINKNDTVTAVYDFEKVHGLPHGETSILYYKRKLTVFNFTVYDMGNSVGTCYVWDESTAKRGSIEVSSCIYDFVETHAQKGIKKFHFYSDNCGGQNRNRIVFAAYMRIARDFKVTITHTYLEKGHTQNEGDSVHALIERTAKNKMIYTPEQWYTMIRWAKQDNKPYIVKEMDTTEFMDFKILLPNCNWTLDTDNEAVYWSQIRQLKILPDESNKIFFKTDFCSHEFKCIVVDKGAQGANKNNRGRGKSKDTSSIPMHSRRLQQAYETKLPIPKAKKVDLKYLCDHKIIPRQYHSFYENLTTGEVEIVNDDEEELV